MRYGPEEFSNPPHQRGRRDSAELNAVSTGILSNFRDFVREFLKENILQGHKKLSYLLTYIYMSYTRPKNADADSRRTSNLFSLRIYGRGSVAILVSFSATPVPPVPPQDYIIMPLASSGGATPGRAPAHSIDCDTNSPPPPHSPTSSTT